MDEDFCFICGEPIHAGGRLSRDRVHTICAECYADEGEQDLYDEGE